MESELPSDPGGVDFDPGRFSGVARLFPLPAPSLYPRVVQPLHIFEERYRALMRDAIDGDGLIAMAVLRPGWEPDYASRPPLERVACLGQIVTHHQLEDGRYNLLLAGVCRVRLLEEVEPPEAFRRARVELLHEEDPDPADAGVQDLRAELIERFRVALPQAAQVEPLQRLMEDDPSLGLLADLAAYTLPLDRELKQAVLAEPVSVARARLIVAALRPGGQGPEEGDDGPGPSGFPPPFSVN